MPPRVAATPSEESDFRQSTPVTSPAKPCPSGLIDTLKTALQSYCGSFQSTTRGNSTPATTDPHPPPPPLLAPPGTAQPTQLHSASPITRSRSRPLSHASS